MTVTDELLVRVLDLLPVTDTVYHDLAYTRPLTAHLIDAIDRSPVHGRILLVGPNIALAQALKDRGLPVEIWHVPGVAITEDMRPHVTRIGDLDSLFDVALDGNGLVDEERYDVIVLPFVLDTSLADPPALLRVVRLMTRTNGTVIVTARRAGALEARLQAIAGRSLLTTDANARYSWSWPSAAPRRRLDTEGLRAGAHRAGFRLVQAEAVVDALATAGVDAMTVTSWLRAHVAHAAKRVLPSLRDTVVASLRALPEAGVGIGSLTRFPTVSVIVLGSDEQRAMRLVAGLDQQTYPRHLIEVGFATADAQGANVALQQATGEVVAFTDDLSSVPDGWVESGVRALSDFNTAVAGGVLAQDGSAYPFLALPDRLPHAGGRGLYLASNSFYRRDAVLSVGGFDEQVGQSWGWDTTAAIRLRAAGFPTVEDETAVVFRAYPFPADRSWMREEYARSRELPYAVKRQPSLRRQTLDHRFFASARTRTFDLALVGVVLTALRRKPGYAVLAAPWLRSIVKYMDVWPPRQWRTTARNLRGIVLRHLIWLAGLVVGSARSRRVVL